MKVLGVEGLGAMFGDANKRQVGVSFTITLMLVTYSSMFKAFSLLKAYLLPIYMEINGSFDE